MIKVIVNGEEKTFSSAISVKALTEELKLDTRKVAIEKNLEIVPKSEFDSNMLQDGDKLEIIHFIGGG